MECDKQVNVANVKEKYKVVYLALIKAKNDMYIIKNSKKLTKNKDGFIKALSTIETLVAYMDDFE